MSLSAGGSVDWTSPSIQSLRFCAVKSYFRRMIPHDLMVPERQKDHSKDQNFGPQIKFLAEISVPFRSKKSIFRLSVRASNLAEISAFAKCASETPVLVLVLVLCTSSGWHWQNAKQVSSKLRFSSRC